MKRRRGAAVAAALKGRRKKGGKKVAKKDGQAQAHAAVVEDDPLKDFIDQNQDAESMFGKRVMMIEKIIAHKNANDKVVLKASDRKDIMRQRQIDGMTHLVDERYGFVSMLWSVLMSSCGSVSRRDTVCVET